MSRKRAREAWMSTYLVELWASKCQVILDLARKLAGSDINWSPPEGDENAITIYDVVILLLDINWSPPEGDENYCSSFAMVFYMFTDINWSPPEGDENLIVPQLL